MQRPSSPLRTPNTFRDSNEISTKGDRTHPTVATSTAAVFGAERMDFDPPTQRSVVRPVDPGATSATRHDASNHNRITNRSLTKSVIRPDDNDDERFNREPQIEPERMMHEDDSVLEASGFDTSRRAELSADEAYALQLQQEEYSRDSLATARHPFDQFRFESDDEPMPSAPPYIANADNPHFTNDEQFAAFLQHQESRTRSRFNRQAELMFPMRQRSNPGPSELLQAGEHETGPVPPMLFPFMHRHPSHNDDGSDDDDDNSSFANIPHPLFQLLAHSNRFPAFRGRGIRRSGNLQDTEDDFGPEDYERLIQLDDTINKKKLTENKINSLPTETFHRTSNNSDEENKCAVCLELYKTGETLRRFPCRHIYHKECADRWLQENNACPICREAPIKVQPVSHSRYQRGPHPPRRPSHTHQTSSSRPPHSRRGRSSQRPS